MRFRLWHLFIAITIVAIGMFSIDQYAYDTVAVEFLSATALHTPTTLALIPKDADYAVEFTIQNTPYSIDGMAFGSFGNSQLFAAELTKSNISQFKGRTVMIRFRRRALPWLPATQVSDELDKYFASVLFFSEC